MEFAKELGRRLKAGIREDEPMSLHTSWKVGGPADYFVQPADREELMAVIDCCRRLELSLFVFGNGTNLLVMDGGIRGVVMKIGAPFHYVHWEEEGVRAGAGTPMPYLARATAQRGLQGLEYAGGIPGSLGGALVMNAGAFGGYIGDLVSQVTVVSPEGEVKVLHKDELQFGYRHSNLQEKGIIVEAVLNMQRADPAVLEERLEQYLAERQRKHPREPSAGSVFRNLPGRPAGQLIEEAGGKGMRVGGAMVSHRHANFIINTGGASAADILRLIRAVQSLVKEKFDVELLTEVRIVGEET